MKALVFDFDGTLCHSMPIIDRAFDDVKEKFNAKKLTSEELKACFGPDESGILLKIFGEEQHHKAFHEYLRSYAEHHDEYLKDFFPGIRELLEELLEEGFEIYLLTGRTSESSIISLTKLDGFKYFKGLYFGGLYGAIKDVRLKELCKDHGLNLDDLIYIGDSTKDVEQCNKVGVKIISAAYDNFEKHDDLESLNPGMVAENIAKLKELILKYGK